MEGAKESDVAMDALVLGELAHEERLFLATALWRVRLLWGSVALEV